jgi:rhodanese-related sulfurtransferase
MIARNRRHSLGLVLPALLLLAGCAVAGAEAPDISADALLERQGADSPPVILDVRSNAEFAQGHIPGAVNIPFDELGDRLGELSASHSDEIVVYCMVGPRARTGEQTLQQNGFGRLRHLEGGFRAWQGAGYPIERAPNS